MQGGVWLAAGGVLLFLLVGTHAEHSSRPRYGGCSVEVKGHTVSSLVSHAQPVYQPYLTICEGHRLCSTYRTTYRVAQRQVYQKVSQLACCPGWKWTKSPSQFGCNEAICRPVCRNGGTCLLPHKCLCPPGWTGRCCQTDVDECARGRHGCSQLCFNVAGSYRCTCRQGHTLLEDGKTCRALEAPPKSTATSAPARSSDPPVRDEVADLRTRMAALEDVSTGRVVLLRPASQFASQPGALQVGRASESGCAPPLVPLHQGGWRHPRPTPNCQVGRTVFWGAVGLGEAGVWGPA
ncbi:epidermal growth factor-like protein 7 isoform X3 [Varanus komodoensis]|uniref:epidermal growth factor-like protein 7 isoform X3 n=1 Tax=Varanus komodoensis TaxID=61221 RepID=UPI001CF76DFB|nr:epidermal growth factor-like protein 7 isoform X3 [Varanus komodoensis]XP_044309009.1 epidermal growth factor-like protein 7 isoform X3 [Varanus komodoensis]